MPFFNLGINNYKINYELVVTSKNNNYRHVERMSKSYRTINEKRARETFETELNGLIERGKKNNPNAEASFRILNVVEEA